MVSPRAFAVLRLITNGSAGQGLTAGSSGKSRGKSLLACDRKVINRTSCIVPSENPIRWIRLIGQNHRILKSDVRGLGPAAGHWSVGRNPEKPLVVAFQLSRSGCGPVGEGPRAQSSRPLLE